MKRFIGVVISIILAALTFDGFFFHLAPWVTVMVPAGEYHQLASLAVYIAIAYFGGLTIPFSILVIGLLSTWYFTRR